MSEPRRAVPPGRTRDRRLDAERLFRAALELAAERRVLVDDGGKIVLVNHQLEQQFGYPSGELIGQAVDVLLPLRSAWPRRRIGAQCGDRPPRRCRSRPVRTAPRRFPVCGGSRSARCVPRRLPRCSRRCGRHGPTPTGGGHRAAVMGKQEVERTHRRHVGPVHQPASGRGGCRHAGGPVPYRGGPRPGSRDVLAHSGRRPAGRSGERERRRRRAAPRSAAHRAQLPVGPADAAVRRSGELHRSERHSQSDRP